MALQGAPAAAHREDPGAELQAAHAGEVVDSMAEGVAEAAMLSQDMMRQIIENMEE